MNATRYDKDGHITWHDWALYNYGVNVADKFATDPWREKPIYNGFRNVLTTTPMNEADSYMIDRIKEARGYYDYDKSLLKNFSELSKG